ncbi:MAG: hypothetical protein ACRDRZ_08140 [Pseudonocardiaceae bacterium]
MKNGSIRDEMLPDPLQWFGDTLTAAARGRQLQDGRVADDGVIPEGHTATRRLCAGVYLDREFRQRLLRDIYNCRKRRVAPSYGYDLLPVMCHAWRAWWLELARDAVAAAIFVAAVMMAPLGTLLMVGLLAMWYTLRACWRVLVESTRTLRKRKSHDYLRGLRFRAKLAACGLLGSAIVVAGSVLAMRSDPQGSGLRGGLVQIGLLVALFVLLFAVVGIVRQQLLDRLHYPSAFKSSRRSRRLSTLHRQQHHPVTVYSGYRPFVGSGLDVHRWSFAQRIIRKRGIGQDRDEEFPQSRPPFKTSEIVGYLKASIERLASTAHSETRLPGLMVRDHVFIDGMYVCNVPDALSDPPSSTVLDEIMAKPREEARYHIACQVEAWDGELVTTVFVHVSLQGRTLYVELSTYALLPTPPRFRVIDEVGGTGRKAAPRMVLKCLSELPDVLHAPRRLVAAPKDLVNAYWAQRDTSSKISKRRDIGAQISAREIAGNGIASEPDEVSAPRRSFRYDDETSYFQLLDVTRHSKIIERRLLAGIEEFLKTKGVDTSEFAQRAEAILNYGMLNIGHGGTNIVGGDLNTGYQPSSVGLAE